MKAAIKKRKYAAMSAPKVANEHDHMTKDKQKKLEDLLQGFNKVFDRKLGYYPHEKIHLELQPNSVPVAQQSYFVAHSNEEPSKDELHN